MKKLIGLVVLSVVFVLGQVLFGGSLEPSSPPGSTMKTLDEVEARIAIKPSDMPKTIGDPGSYYLTGSFTASSATFGIHVTANNVTIDLNGYSLNGNNVGTDAILIDAEVENTAIRNGYIHNWSGMGINGEESLRTYLENVRVDTVGAEGFFLGDSSTAVNCSASNSGRGFQLNANCIITRCSALNNSSNGFGASAGCVFTECTSSGNGNNGLDNVKTLQDIEPRIPIPASSTPAAVFTISSSGSYYLQGDRVSSGTGIQVDVDNVTIDLMGFSLTGPVTGIYSGIYMSGRSNVEIRNGTIKGFYFGVSENDNLGTNHRIIGVRSVHNSRGIYLKSKNNLVKNCTVSNNGESATSGDTYGIFVQSNSIVTGNSVSNNGTSSQGLFTFGISTVDNCTVSNNMVSDNGANARNVYAITTGINSLVTGNTVCNNGFSSSDSVTGISTSYGCIVSNNLSNNNGTSALGLVYGIRTNANCTVTGNTSSYNGTSAGAVVYAFDIGQGCTIRDNTSNDNGALSTGPYVYGFIVGTGSTLTGSTSYRNGTSATGEVYGIFLYGNNLVDQNTAYENGTGAGSATEITYGVTGCVYGINVPPAP